ncbi:uncharacterized protein [Paramisgurnus dabryanus]|uniref:uncharacterized protein isoform X2 n=1 Tax=Paramisgurnus dabryanus TaxID=90735 RepID=UPI003CCF9FDF
MNREDVDCCESSVYVTDDGSPDSVWMSRDQSRTPQPLLDSKLSEEKSRHTQDSELSLTLLCYTESKPTDTQDTTVCDSKQSLQEDQTSTESLDSVCNAGEQQQILQTKLKMCSVKLIDCRNLMMKIKTEPIEIKTEPTEIKTEPTEIKTEPTNIKTETTEEEDPTEEDDDYIPSEHVHEQTTCQFTLVRHRLQQTPAVFGSKCEEGFMFGYRNNVLNIKRATDSTNSFLHHLWKDIQLTETFRET